MKLIKTLILLCFFPLTSQAASLIHPSDFKGTPQEKDAVIVQIKSSVKQTYTELGMGDPSTLRMMEKEELKSFKQLTQVNDRKLLDSVINQYCNIGMCNYSTILMMFNEQKKASQEELSW